MQSEGVRLGVRSPAGTSHMVPNPFRLRRETRRRTREAVDSEKTKHVHSEAADEDIEPDDETAEALREAAIEQMADVSESTAPRARRRGQAPIASEDVARANDIETAKNVNGADRRPTAETSPPVLTSD